MSKENKILNCPHCLVNIEFKKEYLPQTGITLYNCPNCKQAFSIKKGMDYIVEKEDVNTLMDCEDE